MATAATQTSTNRNLPDFRSSDLATQRPSTSDSALASQPAPDAVHTLLWMLSSPPERRQLLAEQQLQDTVDQHLRPVANDPAAFNQLMAQVFGESIDEAAVEQLRGQIINGKTLALPRVVLVDNVDLRGARGAYHAASDTIYLNKQLVGTEVGSRTLLEEFGHALDQRLNVKDAEGDEGELLRRMLTDSSLTDTDIATIRAESDAGALNLGGREIVVEFRHEIGGGGGTPAPVAPEPVTSDYPWAPGGIIYSGLPDRPAPADEPTTPVVDDPPALDTSASADQSPTHSVYEAPDHSRLSGLQPTGVDNSADTDSPADPSGSTDSDGGHPTAGSTSPPIAPAADDVTHTFTYTQNFDAMFGGSTFDDGEERFAAVASGDEEEAIRERLAADSSIPDDAVDDTYDSIHAAAAYFVANPEELDLLDQANDDDEVPDDTFSLNDGRVLLLERTRSATQPSELAMRQQVVRDIGFEEGLDRGWDAEDLEEAFMGDDPILKGLTPTDQEALLEGYVDGLVSGAKEHSSLPVYVPYLHEDAGADFDSGLRSAFAEEAIQLQLERPNDPFAEQMASYLAIRSLEGMSDDERVEFIQSLDGVFEVEGLPPVSESALFARSLFVPDNEETQELESRFSLGVWGSTRLSETESTLHALNTAAGEGGSFTQSEQEFVSVVFTHLPPHGHRFSRTDATGENDMPTAMANSLAIAAYPGDAAAQTQQSARMQSVLETEQGRALLTDQPHIDPITSQYLATTFIHGRAGTDGSVDYWDASAFTENDSQQVAADLTVDTASMLQSNLGQPPLTMAQEQNLRAIVATEQGQDLFGFGERNDHALRTQFTHIVVERGLDVDDFGDGNGWDNGAINGEYFVLMAQRGQPQTPLTDAQQDNLRAIGESVAGRRVIGFESPVDEAGRARFLAFTVAEGWTPETYAQEENPSLNTTFLRAFAGEHADLFRPGGERYDALSGELQIGDTRQYVNAALGLPLDTPANEHIDRIVAAIDDRRGTDSAGNSTALAVIPVTVNTGSTPVDLMLFEVTDGDSTHYVDLNGKHYSDVSGWWNSNGLPSGTVAFTGTTDGLIRNSHFVSPGTDGDASIITAKTENFEDTWLERNGASVVTGLAIVGSVAVIVATWGAATPLVAGSWAGTVGTGGAIILGGVGAYTLYEGGSELIDHWSHGGSLSFSDPTARGAYLNLFEGGLTIVTAGASAVTFRGGRLASGLAARPGLSSAVSFATNVDEAYAIGSHGYSALQIINSDLPVDERLKQLAILGFFTSLDIGVPALVSHRVNANADFVARARAIDPDLTVDQITRAVESGATTPEQIALDPLVRLAASEGSLDVSGNNATIGPATSVAGVTVDGTVYHSDAARNLVEADSRGRTIDLPADRYNTDLGAHVQLEGARDGDFPEQRYITIDVDPYMAELKQVYATNSNELDPRTEAAIRDYIGDGIDIPVLAQDEGGGLSNGAMFPGTHAEVVATNNLLTDTASQNIYIDIDEITIATVRNNQGNPPPDFVACPHCSGILNGADVHIVTD